MTLRIVKTGQEPILREAVDWLESKGIPAKCIRAVSMDAEIGQPMTITATFYVDEPEEVGSSFITLPNGLRGRLDDGTVMIKEPGCDVNAGEPCDCERPFTPGAS